MTFSVKPKFPPLFSIFKQSLTKKNSIKKTNRSFTGLTEPTLLQSIVHAKLYLPLNHGRWPTRSMQTSEELSLTTKMLISLVLLSAEFCGMSWNLHALLPSHYLIIWVSASNGFHCCVNSFLLSIKSKLSLTLSLFTEKKTRCEALSCNFFLFHLDQQLQNSLATRIGY